jgi:PAS domain S-box-containing protein
VIIVMSRPPLWLVTTLVAVLLVVLGGGVWLYRTQEQHLRHEVDDNLRAIAQLKVAQIGEWRAERLADAAQFAETLDWSGDAARWLAASPPGLDARLLDRFRSLQQQRECTDVVLLDARGQVRLSLTGRTSTLDEPVARALALALRDRQPVLTDLYRDAEGVPRVGTVAPIGATDGRTAEPIGAVLLLRDVRLFLYPLLQSWPVPSRSAETQLVRRDGDSVVYLNELRHRRNTALALRFPLSRGDMPAVRAVLGEHGVMEGRDYRGVAVLAALQAVPGSSWFVVAKVDTSEAFAAWRAESGLILILIMSCLVAAGAALALVWQRNAKAHFRALYQAEAARGEGEARYATTLMSIGDGVITTDASGRVTLLNHVAQALTGVRSEEACGQPLTAVFRIINEETRQPVEDPVAAVLRRGAIVGLANHTVLISKSGDEYPIADSGAPICNEAGDIVGVVLVFRNQTEERRAQKALLESEQRYRGLFEHMLHGFTYCRMIFENGEPKDFIYLTVNRAFETLTGLKDVAGRWVTEVIPGIRETDRELFEIYGRVALTGNPERFERFVRALDMWFSISVYSPEREFFVAVFDVVTERKRTEQALRESEDRHRRLVELLPNAVWVHRDGRFTYVNPAALRLLGARDERELIGQPMIDRVHPDFRDSVLDRIRRILEQQGTVPAVEEKLLRVSGGEVYAEVTAMPFKTEGHQEVLVVARDMTDRRRAEAERETLQQQLLQAQKMEAVGRLAGGVAHDFNNMLTVIQGYTESILGGLKPADPIRADLLEVQAAAGRSADLTRQLLAFSRRQTIAPRVMDLNEQLTGMNRLLDRILGEDISLRFTLAAGLWPVCLDVTQLDQIVANLAVNARDATPDGGTLTVETANVTLTQEYSQTHLGVTPGDFVKLSISDSGCGMDQETLAHVFEPFFTTKAEAQGTGLGLATVFGIVEQNQGMISVYSERGHGTTISIYFPRYRGEEVAPPIPVLEPKPAGGHETILLVEDEAQLRRLGKRILQRLGYTVLDAASPGDALTLCERHPGEIHLLLTDVVMPHMNGMELEARIRASRPGVKALFMSGYTPDTIAHRGVLDPGIDFLQKPFAADALGRKVREVLDRR